MVLLVSILGGSGVRGGKQPVIHGDVGEDGDERQRHLPRNRYAGYNIRILFLSVCIQTKNYL